MRFPRPLVRGTLVRRYKRFLADVDLGGGAEVTVHCPNPGSMLGLDHPGSAVWLSAAVHAGRKYPYTWELVRADGVLVGINTAHPNALAAEAIAAGAIPELAGYASIRREVRYGRNSRIDLLLEAADRATCHVEVKNVHLRRGADAPVEFPDCVTARGAKHLAELADVARAGGRAVMLYVAQRGDAERFAIAADLDPAYAEALAHAKAAGVEALAYKCRVTEGGIEVDGALGLDV